MAQVHGEVSQELLEKVRQRRRESGITISFVIRRALEMWVEGRHFWTDSPQPDKPVSIKSE